MGKKRNRTSQCGDEEKRVRRVESEGKTKLDIGAIAKMRRENKSE